MEPFADKAVRLVAFDDVGRRRLLSAVGIRLVLAKGVAIHVGLSQNRIHVQPGGIQEELVSRGGKRRKFVVGYLQTLVGANGDGVSFEWRKVGKRDPRLRGKSFHVAVVGTSRREVIVRHRRFSFSPAPGSEVRIEVAGRGTRPVLSLSAHSDDCLVPGQWKPTLVICLTPSGWNSMHVLLRMVKATTLA